MCFANKIYDIAVGIKTWLMGCGIPEKLIHELDWWEEITFPISTLERLSGKLSVTCTPAQHNSGEYSILSQNMIINLNKEETLSIVIRVYGADLHLHTNSMKRKSREFTTQGKS